LVGESNDNDISMLSNDADDSPPSVETASEFSKDNEEEPGPQEPIQTAPAVSSPPSIETVSEFPVLPTPVKAENLVDESKENDDIDDDCIPPGLASFVQEVNKTLQEVHSEFMQASSKSSDFEAEIPEVEEVVGESKANEDEPRPHETIQTAPVVSSPPSIETASDFPALVTPVKAEKSVGENVDNEEDRAGASAENPKEEPLVNKEKAEPMRSCTSMVSDDAWDASSYCSEAADNLEEDPKGKGHVQEVEGITISCDQ
jgi:hypothetical protein